MKRVFVCSPYAGDIEGNTLRAIEYCRAEVEAGNVPFAPHLHNPQILPESDPEGRRKGIELGLRMLEVCDELHVYGDRISEGMTKEVFHWVSFCLSIGKFPVIVSHLKSTAGNGEGDGNAKVSRMREDIRAASDSSRPRSEAVL